MYAYSFLHDSLLSKLSGISEMVIVLNLHDAGEKGREENETLICGNGIRKAGNGLGLFLQGDSDDNASHEISGFEITFRTQRMSIMAGNAGRINGLIGIDGLK